MNTSTALRFALLANLSLVAAGCNVFGSDDASSGSPGDQPSGAGLARKAPPVGGPADASELTEAFGVFVTPNGASSGDGSRARPLDTIQSAIELGKRVGKRVYVCKGTYKEALVLADSISVIGGLDCGDASEWRTGKGVSRIESPTSPAIRAKDIVSATRLEGLDVVAPNGSSPSASSIGLVAAGSTLTVARSKITAGNGADGADGVEGTQLTTSSTSDGAAFYSTAQCAAGTTCDSIGSEWYAPAPRLAGTNACDGKPGHPGEAGGNGGGGGIYKYVVAMGELGFAWQVQYNRPATLGEKAGGGFDGARGPDGASGAPIGALTSDGYAPADGRAGQDGAPGHGGAGGDGASPAATLSSGPSDAHYWWRGFGGAGGGAGGCPGLAGTPGGGGGASIAAVVLESTVHFDETELVAARGGNSGRGTFGSDRTSGGKGGDGGFPTLTQFAYGQNGGRGGAAGISGNGTSGPSIAIAYRGTVPSMENGSKVTPGTGGDAIEARSHTDVFGTTKTIPSAPAGVTKDVFAL